MKRLTLFILIATFAPNTVLAEEGVDTAEDTNAPIHVTVEPVLTPNITVQAAAPPNVTVNLPEEENSFLWKLVGPLGTLLGIVIGASMIFWQLRRQHESSLILQEENARKALQADIYNELRLAISNALAAEGRVSSYVHMIPFSLRNYISQTEKGLVNAGGPPTMRERLPVFVELQGEMSSAVIKLITIFESYAIAVPQFEVFQLALNVAMHDELHAFNPLHSDLLGVLPIDMSSHLPSDLQGLPNTHYVPPPPNEDKLAQVERSVKQYLAATDDIGSYIHDLLVEAQNTLLKDLYPDQRAPVRQPLDPTYKVVTSKNAAELTRYFLGETRWGKSKKESEAWVLANLATDDDQVADNS